MNADVIVKNRQWSHGVLLFDLNPDSPVTVTCTSNDGAPVLGIVQYIRAKKSPSVKIWAEECFMDTINIYPEPDADESITLFLYVLGDPVDVRQLVIVQYGVANRDICKDIDCHGDAAKITVLDEYADIFENFYAEIASKVKQSKTFAGLNEKQRLINIETAHFTLFGEKSPNDWTEWGSASLCCEDTRYGVRPGSKSRSPLLARIKFPIVWRPCLRQFEERQFEERQFDKQTIIHPVPAPIPLMARVAKLTDGKEELYVRATKKLSSSA